MDKGKGDVRFEIRSVATDRPERGGVAYPPERGLRTHPFE